MKRPVIFVAFFFPNLYAIHTLHAILKKNDFEVISVFLKERNVNGTMTPPSQKEIDSLINFIKRFDPILVGFSVRTLFFNLAAALTVLLKQEISGKIMWGGIHPSIKPLQCLEYADIVCIGEGDEAIVELMSKLTKGESINEIKNLWIKDGDKIVKNELRPLIEDLNSIPLPNYSLDDKYFIENNTIKPIRIAPAAPTGRGCPFSCAFCSHENLREMYKGKGKYLRRRSVDNVIAELVETKKRNKPTEFGFSDDVFTVDIRWIREFCEKYKSAVNLPFSCYSHATSINEEMIKLLKNAGAVQITMGIQAGSEKIRHEIFKRYDTNENIIKYAWLLHKYGISCVFDIIMDNPLETEEEKLQTLELLLKLPRPFTLHTHTLTHFPETRLTKLLLEKGLISEMDIEDKKQNGFERYAASLDLGRDKANMFWDALYYLASTNYLPAKSILALSRSKFIKRNPKSLTLLLRSFSPYARTVRRGSKIDLMRFHFWSFIMNKGKLKKIRKYLKSFLGIAQPQ